MRYVDIHHGHEMTEKLSDAETSSALTNAPDWQLDPAGGCIVRKFDFKDFSGAFAFMTQVALAAEKFRHHPDWSNSYDTVTIRLSTHDAGGLSAKDFELAKRIDAIAAA